MQSTKVIKYDHPPTEGDVAQLRALGHEIVHISKIAPEVTIKLPTEQPGQIRAAAAEILLLAGVESIENDFPVGLVLNDVAPLVAIASVWDAGLAATVLGPMIATRARGQGVKVAILDTGIDPTFPGFKGRIAITKDYSGEGPGPDGHGHGTHCAGIVGQTDAAEAGYIGMAPEVTYHIYKVLGANGSGSATGIAQAMEEALADGADIISMSLGGSNDSAEPDFLQRRADLIGARIPVVVASGNSGPQTKPFRETPARAANVITVGASEKDDDVASFTSRGVTDDGRIKPNVYAPGHKIAAARAAGTSMGTPLSPHTTVASGTSMATPCLAGVLAALMSHDPSLRGNPRLCKAVLMGRGRDIHAEGPRILGSTLLTQPYPLPSTGVDHSNVTPAPPAPGEPDSPCLDLVNEAIDAPTAQERRRLLKKVLAAARSALTVGLVLAAGLAWGQTTAPVPVLRPTPQPQTVAPAERPRDVPSPPLAGTPVVPPRAPRPVPPTIKYVDREIVKLVPAPPVEIVKEVPPASSWKIVLATILNTVGTMVLVLGVAAAATFLRARYPFLLPIAAGIIGPLLAWAQDALGAWLGIPITFDLPYVLAGFTGMSAIGVAQIGIQWVRAKRLHAERDRIEALGAAQGRYGVSLVEEAELHTKVMDGRPI
jgi:hypothetical protein